MKMVFENKFNGNKKTEMNQLKVLLTLTGKIIDDNVQLTEPITKTETNKI